MHEDGWAVVYVARIARDPAYKASQAERSRTWRARRKARDPTYLAREAARLRAYRASQRGTAAVPVPVAARCRFREVWEDD